MRFTGGKKRCANCFSEIKAEPCSECGYSKSTAAVSPGILPLGMKLAGRYITGGMIGRGGFGITYLAFDRKADKILAIKEYFPANIAVRERKGLLVQPISEKKSGVYHDGLERFSSESGLISQFNGNPNIVNVFECFSENNTSYCVMEHLRGLTLERYIEKHGALNVEQCVYLAEKLALALVAIHSAGLLHRDIAPDNIMLCEDGKIKLLDFGAARRVREETSLTVMMKTGFTPVEQYSGGASLTPRSDIYALGMVLFYALTEKQPKSVFMRMEDDREFSDSLWAVPESFRNVIKKAAAINSAERFDSAADFLNALSDMKIRGEIIMLSKEDFTGKNSPEAYHKNPPAKPNYFLGGICAGVLLCAAVLTPILLFGRPRPESVENPSAHSPVTIEFGSFGGNLSNQYAGRISQNTLDEFGGNVKITLEVETLPDFINAPEIYLLYPVDSSGANMIDYCAPISDSSAADVTGAVSIEKGTGQFSFVLTRPGIEALNGGFGFETYQVAIKSVQLEAADRAPEGFSFTDLHLPDNGTAEYSVSSQEGNTRVTAALKEYYVSNWGGRLTDYIPKAAFDGFEGDIKLTLQFEYSPKSSEPGQEYQILYLQTLGYLENHIFEFAEVVQVYDEEGTPLISRMDNHGISPALSCTECSIILPKNIVDKVCGGLGFTGDNMRITGVVIEDA